MTKILDLDDISDTDSHSASGMVAPLAEHLTQPNVELDYDAHSLADSIPSIAESLAPPEFGSDDLRYQTVDQLKRELETAIISSLRARNGAEGSVDYDERKSFAAKKRVWDTRLSAVSAALLERIPEEHAQYRKKLRDEIQASEEDIRAYDQSRKMREEEERSRRESQKQDTPNIPEETVEERVARIKKKTEELFQKYSELDPLNSPAPSTSSSTTSTWKYLRGKLGDFKDFILGDSPQMERKEGQENKKSDDIQLQAEERKHPVKATATTTDHQQPKNSEVQWLDERREVNSASADDFSNAAIPSSLQDSGTHTEIRTYPFMESPTASLAPSDLAPAEVCQYINRTQADLLLGRAQN